MNEYNFRYIKKLNFAWGNIFIKISNYFGERWMLKRRLEHISENRKQLVCYSFDYISLRINIDGIFEKEELDILFDWLSSLEDNIFAGIAIDIGANIGNHSLYFADKFNRVLSYEPHPQTFKILELNAASTNNISCFNYGLSDVRKVALLETHPNKTGMGGSSVVEFQNNYTQHIKLERLDDVIPNLHSINLIKIDIEGHEFQALIGAENIIKNNFPIILFEQFSHDFVNGNSKVVNLLRTYGYSYFGAIQKFPLATSDDGIIKKIVYMLSRNLWCSSLELNVSDSVSPGFYHFLIAIPDRYIDKLEGFKH